MAVQISRQKSVARPNNKAFTIKTAETITLGINTATSKTEVVLLQGEKVLLQKSWRANYDELEKVMPVVEKALMKVKKHLSRILIVNGPGPFTSLRIGVALANTLAYALNAKIYSQKTWEYLRNAVPSKKQKNTAIMVRAGGTHVAILAPGKSIPKRMGFDSVEGFLKKNTSIKYMLADVPPETRRAIKATKNVRYLQQTELKSCSEILREVDWKKLRCPTKNIVKPIYLLPPKITQSKKPVFV